MRIKVIKDNRLSVIECNPQDNLLNVLRSNGFGNENLCGGKGICGKCKVRIIEGNAPISKSDKRFFSQQDLDNGIRLSCTLPVQSDMTIEIGTSNLVVLTDIKGLDNLECDTCGYGVAIDIGTTTVACYLVDLATAKILAIQSASNSQRSYGADVISRIKYTMEDENGLSTLYQLITNQLNDMVAKLAVQANIKISDISRVCITGNCVMQHILTNTPVKSIGVAPYNPVFVNSITASPAKYNLNFGTELYITPSISSFVGGDITAGLLVCSHITDQTNYLLLDLGTNGELSLVTPDVTYACATAAGPAFEGGALECGTGAIPGAINKVYVEQDNIKFTTINNQKAVGLCGSGILDSIAALVETENVSISGKMECGDKYNFTDKVYLSAKDVRDIQLAKGAIRAGIETLLDKAGLTSDKLSAIYFAGGFGNFLNVDSALATGLLPGGCPKIESLANTALSGAIRCLVSKSERLQAEKIASTAEGYDLSMHPNFYDYYSESMFFGDVDF